MGYRVAQPIGREGRSASGAGFAHFRPARSAFLTFTLVFAMTKRIDWDEVTRKQQAKRHGTSYAYDELPPVGSWADQQRILAREKKSQQNTPAGGLKNTSGAISRQSVNRPLSKCQFCEALVSKMERHLKKAHNAIPDYKRKTPKNAKTTTQKKLKAAERTVNLSKAVVRLNQIVEDPKSGKKLIKLDQRGRVLEKSIPVIVK